MTVIPTSRLLIIALLLTGIIGAGIRWHQPFGQFVVDHTGRFAAPVSVQINNLALVAGRFIGRGSLAGDDVRLSQALTQVQSLSAQVSDLQRQNADLQSVAGLQNRVQQAAIIGDVFSYPTNTAVAQIVLNRGSRDGVAVGDIITTMQDAVVGVVVQVFSDHSVILEVGDPNLEITARVAGTTVTGLVRTDPSQGIILDLVQKSELVTVGQQVVTSGNDQFPAGLVIGSIQAVDMDNTALFQIVHLSPAITGEWDGEVLIMHP